MKRKNLFLFTAVCGLAITIAYTGCSKDEVNPPPEDKGFTETYYSNPGDPKILTLDSAGRKVTYLGVKTVNGMPTSITQALVDAPDLNPLNQTLIQFDAQGRVSSLSSPAGGMMGLTYVSDTSVVIVFNLPDNQGAFQTSFNPLKPTKSKGCNCDESSGTVFTRRQETSAIVPFKDWYQARQLKSSTLLNAASGSGNIYAQYNVSGSGVSGLNVTATAEASDKSISAVAVEAGEQIGAFRYILPTTPAPPAPPAGYGDKALELMNKVCLGAIPLGLAKHQICLRMVNPIAIVKCEAILTAYVWLCRANTGRRIGNYVKDSYSAEQIKVTITAQHASLPTKTMSVTAKPSMGTFPEANFYYDDYCVLSQLYTNPADPDPEQGYTITAKAENFIAGVDQVTLSMIGTDGYTKEQTFTLDASATCSMFIPGAAQGVRDDITATVLTSGNPMAGQVRKISIIF